jgi:hypothetical protein
MIDPPVFQKNHELVGVFVVNALLARSGELSKQIVMQFVVSFRTPKIKLLQKSFLDLKMYARIIVHHVHDRGKRVFDVMILYAEIKRVYGGDNAPVLFVDDGDAQIIRWVPNNKNIMIQQDVMRFVFGLLAENRFFHHFPPNILLSRATSESPLLSG